MKDGSKPEEGSENEDTTSTEGLIEDEDDEKDVGQAEEAKDDLDLLDSAFLRDGITLEPEKESSDSGNDSDGLYDFKDTLGVQQFPHDLDLRRSFALYSRQPRQCEYLYGKRYTAKCVRRVDPSQLPSLMSLKVQPPDRAFSKTRSGDEETELSKFVQKLQKPDRKRRSPETSVRRRRSPLRRPRNRSRSPRRLTPRERIHRSPTGIERYRYWTGEQYLSKINDADLNKINTPLNLLALPPLSSIA